MATRQKYRSKDLFITRATWIRLLDSLCFNCLSKCLGQIRANSLVLEDIWLSIFISVPYREKKYTVQHVKHADMKQTRPWGVSSRKGVRSSREFYLSTGNTIKHWDRTAFKWTQAILQLMETYLLSIAVQPTCILGLLIFPTSTSRLTSSKLKTVPP